jgi:hypothetical protein
MSAIPDELLVYREQLLDAIDCDLHRPIPSSRTMQRRSLRLAIPTLAVVAATTGAVVLGLTLSAASPQGAYAAAQRALAATAAAPSGTMTTTELHAGVSHTLEATRWNGKDIAWSPGFGLVQQLLLIGGGLYVQTSDGTWLHFANASDVAPKPLGGLVHVAQDNIADTTAQQILALTTGVQKTEQADGTTLYTGAISNGSLDAGTLNDNAVLGMIFGSIKNSLGADGIGNHAPLGSDGLANLQLQMSVGSEGLVRQVSVTFQPEGAASAATPDSYTWSVTYTQLGNTPPITPPASSTDVPAGTLPPSLQIPPPEPSTK